MLEIGKTIRIVRESKGMTLSTLADQAELSVPFLSLVERGKRSPSLMTLRKLARVLSVPAEALFIVAASADTSLSPSNERTARLLESLERFQKATALLAQDLSDE